MLRWKKGVREDDALPPLPDDEGEFDEDDDIDEDDGPFVPYGDTLTSAAMETEWSSEKDDDLDAAWYPFFCRKRV